MRIALLIIILFYAARYLAQPCFISNGDSLNSEIGWIRSPEKFYTYYNLPFVDWKEKPEKFYFALYDRWGRKLMESTDPDYELDGINFKGNQPVEDGEYYFLIQFQLPGNKIMKYCGKIIYSGFYMCG